MLDQIFSRAGAVLSLQQNWSDDCDWRHRQNQSAFQTIRPAVWFCHCAAYTNGDGAQTNVDLCRKVNADASANVAIACREIGSKMAYISTDFVFDGLKKHPYLETDCANPISVYGATKYEGEQRIKEILDRFFIVRISWLYGRNGKNFVYTIRNAGMNNPQLKVVNDQIGTPTFTLDVADGLLKIIRKDCPGIFHLTGEGECSWYDFAAEILNLYGIQVPVIPISSSELSRPAPRPAYSVLENARFWSVTGGKMPDWKDSLRRFVAHHACWIFLSIDPCPGL